MIRLSPLSIVGSFLVLSVIYLNNDFLRSRQSSYEMYKKRQDLSAPEMEVDKRAVYESVLLDILNKYDINVRDVKRFNQGADFPKISGSNDFEQSIKHGNVLGSITADQVMNFTDISESESGDQFKWYPNVENIIDECTWLNRNSCDPQHNIAFLKTHKCASSTVQNMLMRFGDAHNLLFAMPVKSHIFPIAIPFNASYVHAGVRFHTDKYNIFTMHSKWNKKEVSKIIFPGAVYFTIVREPSETFMSMYDYFAFTKSYNMTVSRFIRTHDIDMQPRPMGCLSYNLISCIMGAKSSDYTNSKAIRLLTAEADENFDLVMIADRFEESLVLLSKLLCWPYEDLVSLNSNSRFKSVVNLTSDDQLLLKDKLKPDYFVYNYFSAKFDAMVKTFGEQRMADEIEKLRQVTNAKVTECNFIKTEPKHMDRPEMAGNSKVAHRSTKSTDPTCQGLVRDEQLFVRMLKEKQEKMLMKSVL